MLSVLVTQINGYMLCVLQYLSVVVVTFYLKL